MASPESEVRERVPIRGIRRVIAEHMSEAVHRAAHFTYVEEVDVERTRACSETGWRSTSRSRGPGSATCRSSSRRVVAGLKAHPRAERV